MPEISGTPVQIETTFVLSMYGRTMIAVQAFERVLAALTVALDAKSWRTRPFKSEKQMRRYLEGLVSRCIHGFQKASASELRNMLVPDGLDPDLLADIDERIKWRDRLAHRYLIEKMVLGSGELRFKRGAMVELEKVSQQFDSTGKWVNDLLAKTIASRLKDTTTPPAAVELFAGIVQPLMYGGPWEPKPRE